MKIEQLTIENFKCFKREQTFDFGRLTILTGANSSGKSSVIHALLSALQSGNFPNNYSTNGRLVNLGDFKEISNGHKIDNIIKIGIKTGHYDNFQSYWVHDEISGLPKFHKIEKFDYSTNSYIEDKNDYSIAFQFNAAFKWEEYINYIGAFRHSPQRTYLEKNLPYFAIDTEGEGYIDQIVEWEKRSNGKIKELVEVMKDLELIEEIKINRLGGGRFEVLAKPINSNVLTSLSNVGFGISQFLPIIVADLKLPEESLLFLAEPEIHLHPSVQSKFGDYIVKQINERQKKNFEVKPSKYFDKEESMFYDVSKNKNYIIETHSEYFLNRIRLAIVKGELKKEDVKVYFMENKGDDTDVYDIDFKKNGAIKNAPKSYFRTYMTDTMDIALNAFAE